MRGDGWRRRARRRPLSRPARDRVRAAARRPVRRHAARRLRRRRRSRSRRRRRGDPMRDWGRLRHNDHSLWWSMLARNKRSVALNLREARGPGDRGAAVRDRRRRASRTSGPGTMERWGLGPEEVHARNPRRDLRARDRLRADRPLPRPPRLRVGGRGDRRPALHQRLPRPGAAAHGHLARRHARRPVGVPGHPARALRARRARRDGPGRRRVDHRRLLRDDGVDRRSSTRRPASCASRPARACRASRPSNVYRSKRRQVGRDRGQPRHALAAAGRRSWATRSWARTSASPPTTRAASTRTLLDELIGEWAAQPHGRGARRDRQRRRASCARRSTRPPTSTTTRTSASATCSSSYEDEVHGHDDGAGRRAEAERHARERPPGRALDRRRGHRRRAGRARHRRRGASRAARGGIA